MTLVCPKTFMSKNVYGRVDPKKMPKIMVKVLPSEN
jgi:hypothetical protein